MLMKKTIYLCVLTLLTAVSAWSFQSEITAFFQLEGDKLIMPDPDEYRRWELAGVGVVPNDLNRHRAIFPGVHLVYVDPVAYKHRRDRGFYPDGTVIVMENFHQKSQEGVSGKGYFESGPRDVLVSVKDRRKFTSKVWSYYLFTDEDIKKGINKKAAMPKSDCQACHISAADDDEVFTSYYPRLSPGKTKAKPIK
ncbi:MAG: hypothetical protein CR997_05400 [Acidobacteria bacterium]|nr:MAG: hypothetical protein CR997_05400 [Acidobacteriota bacterium]